MKKIIGAFIAAIAVTAAVGGCQSDSSTSATTTSNPGQTTAHGTQAPGTAATQPGNTDQPQTGNTDQPQSGGQPANSGAPATSGKGRCVDVNSAVVGRAVKSLGPSVGGDSYYVDSALDAPIGSCPQLLWVLVGTPHGTASSPWHVLFFNHDGYLGTATAKATSYTKVVGSTERSVQVQYRWLQGNDANCCPSGGPAVISFNLGADGRTVTPDPAIPDQVANPKR
ncbi:LppP/LprE family lipoprotein [Nocardia arthritidis]|uniref:LppP/LprE family lipoprotein n=1 Tax=Nocardia arthritidis TaxID=228602 RepID=UPI00142E8645|nr:LppP/LprE family lipoprotein [Nocardia arthritidis]